MARGSRITMLALALALGLLASAAADRTAAALPPAARAIERRVAALVAAVDGVAAPLALAGAAHRSELADEERERLAGLLGALAPPEVAGLLGLEPDGAVPAARPSAAAPAAAFDAAARAVALGPDLASSADHLECARAAALALRARATDLARFLDPAVLPDADQRRARAAVAFGEAELAAVDYARLHASALAAEAAFDPAELLELGLRGGPPGEALAAPAVALLAFPRTAGAAFVRTVRARRGADGVAALYADPPRSTAEILHPERYFERGSEPASAALDLRDLAPLLPAGFAAGEPFVLGELGIELWLRFAADDPVRGLRAAAGWSADRGRAWVRRQDPKPPETVLQWEAEFREEADAEKLIDGLLRLFRAWKGTAFDVQREEARSSVGLFEQPGQRARYLALRSGTRVRLVGSRDGLDVAPLLR